jgi:hypothetical protein
VSTPRVTFAESAIPCARDQTFLPEQPAARDPGPTIDLGFGAGQLLERLPEESLELEVNPHLVEEARQAG